MNKLKAFLMDYIKGYKFPLDITVADGLSEKEIREEYGELADIKLRLMRDRGVIPRRE